MDVPMDSNLVNWTNSMLTSVEEELFVHIPREISRPGKTLTVITKKIASPLKIRHIPLNYLSQMVIYHWDQITRKKNLYLAQNHHQQRVMLKYCVLIPI